MAVDLEKKVRKHKIPTIVLDYDDTIINFLGGLCRVHNKRYGTVISANDLKEWDFTSLEVKDVRGNTVKGAEVRATFKEYESNGLYVGLELLDKAKDALNIMKRLGYTIIVITAREEKYGKDTELNLIFQDIAQFIEQVYFTAEKVKKIQELSKTHRIHLFADDKASTCQAIMDGCKVDHVCLIEKPHNLTAEVGDEVKKVKDLFDTLRYLKDVSKTEGK